MCYPRRRVRFIHLFTWGVPAYPRFLALILTFLWKLMTNIGKIPWIPSVHLSSHSINRQHPLSLFRIRNSIKYLASFYEQLSVLFHRTSVQNLPSAFVTVFGQQVPKYSWVWRSKLGATNGCRIGLGLERMD